MKLKDIYSYYYKKLKKVYPWLTVGNYVLDKNCDIYFEKDKNSYGDVYLTCENNLIEAKIDFCHSDYRIVIMLVSEDEFRKICNVLNEQFARWDYYYDKLNNHEDEIINKFKEAKKRIDKELKNEKIKEESSCDKYSCIADLVNETNKKHVFYRMGFTPMGFTATVIYDEPHDEQIEYKLDEEFDLFLEDIKRNLGLLESAKAK